MYRPTGAAAARRIPFKVLGLLLNHLSGVPFLTKPREWTTKYLKFVFKGVLAV